jgi:two-component system OmpR family sensor kinase
VALMLLLLTLAIVLIGVASNIALRNYLTAKMDNDLKDATSQLEQKLPQLRSIDADALVLPSDFVIAIPTSALKLSTPTNKPWWVIRYAGLTEQDFPALPADPNELKPKAGQFLTVNATDGSPTWRLRIGALPGGQIFVVAEQTTTVSAALHRLFWIYVYGGAAVLILAASIGTDLVRRSLRPLSAIEKTAGAIAGGDLTQRVPDPEEGEEVACTEVGSLARSLNTMLAQIETAFTARAASETSARAAESAARDAAVAAQVSEARARRSEEKMRQFVADASHELRTPLTTIRGFAELYRQGAARTPEETAALVKRIEDEAQRMGLLVEDLLLLARMDQERPLRPVAVELRVLAVDALQAARVVAPEREITLSVARDAGELVVLGDDARLRQVLGNLMGNALAHTPAGTPVELRLRREGEQAVLEVADWGPGLDADQRERVFERFYRTDTARTRRDGQLSTGLGLAIVAALVTAHNGTVEVESEVGKGATFRVRLPLVDLVDEVEDQSDAGVPRHTDAL